MRKLLYICSKFINNLNLNTMFNTKQLQTAHRIIDSLVAYSNVQILHLMYKVEGDYMILDIKEPVAKRYSINANGEFKQLF